MSGRAPQTGGGLRPRKPGGYIPGLWGRPVVLDVILRCRSVVNLLWPDGKEASGWNRLVPGCPRGEFCGHPSPVLLGSLGPILRIPPGFAGFSFLPNLGISAPVTSGKMNLTLLPARD